MDKNVRRRSGAHYTAEENIMKVLRPLFLDDLRNEFKKMRNNRRKLREFHQHLAGLTFLDPACGCGNFLVLAYRELRRLEMDVLQAIYNKDAFDLVHLVQVNVDQFYGMEIQEFPVRVAETALWIMDHQMNIEATERFGKYFVRLPLQKSPAIILGNALQMDWNKILPNKKCSYLLGNPPYVGKHYQNKTQKEDLKLVCGNIKNYRSLDYVSCWYLKAAQYIQGTTIRVAFVSTNSITQGEQVEIIWSELLRYHVTIDFAYQTFVWTSEAKGKAHVHCVIIGFSLRNNNNNNKRLFEQCKGTFNEKSVQNINPYLVEGNNILIKSRSKPISKIPEMIYGNKPVDGGHLIFTDKEKIEFIKQQPESAKYFRPLISAKEFLNGKKRWCLWLVGVSPAEIKPLHLIRERVRKVKETRLASIDPQARALANFPMTFRDTHNPKTCIVIPRVSSENRKYIPMSFIDRKFIVSDSCQMIPNATLFHFGILTSTMHMVWMRHVCGRLESRYRYSANIVYNNFPLPENIKKSQQQKIEEKAKIILSIRKKYLRNSLADLYDPDFMPSDLVKAHRELDRAVDCCYRYKPFNNDQERLTFLFELYEKIITGSLLVYH
jgi:hypothetical protein